jgi:hypothetical protein
LTTLSLSGSSAEELKHQLLYDTTLSQDQRDELALVVCKAYPLCRVFILYPRAIGHDKEMYEIIKQYGTILHEKKIFLKHYGPLHIIKQFYYDHPWFGDYGNKVKKVAHKAEKTFRHGAQKGNPLRALLVESFDPDYEQFRLSKVAIREIFKTRHVCHSAHSHPSAVHMSQAVFSTVTIDFFNTREKEYLPHIEKALAEFGEWLEQNNLDIEKVCIVDKACKATYGWKDTSTIDFVYSESLDSSLRIPEQYRNKSDDPKYVTIKNSLIFDHDKHFYHRGFKFAVM